jgi:hypothetical protein
MLRYDTAYIYCQHLRHQNSNLNTQKGAHYENSAIRQRR